MKIKLVSQSRFYKEVGSSLYRVMHENVKSRNSNFVLVKSTANKLVKVYKNKIDATIDMYEPINNE